VETKSKKEKQEGNKERKETKIENEIIVIVVISFI